MFVRAIEGLQPAPTALEEVTCNMPWTCPSCHSLIRHEADEMLPRQGVVYRCHVCRLDLVVDATLRRLVLLDRERD